MHGMRRVKSYTYNVVIIKKLVHCFGCGKDSLGCI